MGEARAPGQARAGRRYGDATHSIVPGSDPHRISVIVTLGFLVPGAGRERCRQVAPTDLGWNRVPGHIRTSDEHPADHAGLFVVSSTNALTRTVTLNDGHSPDGPR